MKYYNQIVGNLNEALDEYQKKTVDFWSSLKKSKAPEISAHAMNGEHTIYLPLKTAEDHIGEVPDDIHSHLKNHGFSIPSFHEYRAGYATDKHGRMVTIGKALNRTKAPEELKRKFENDPVRSQSTKETKDLMVAITHHPHHVAGMSTDRGWTSCMHMYDGCNESYLKHDIMNGTHVAYLIHKDDKEIEKPIARIALKPFHANDGSNHTILRPEQNTYGSQSNHFTHTVKEWSETHFPTKEGKTYHINDNLYDDTIRTIAPSIPKEDSHQTAKDFVFANFIQSETLGVGRKIPENIHDEVIGIVNDMPNRIHHLHSILKRCNAKTMNKVLDHMSSKEKADAVAVKNGWHNLIDSPYDIAPNHARDILHHMTSHKNEYDYSTMSRVPLHTTEDVEHAITHIDDPITVARMHAPGSTEQQKERMIKNLPHNNIRSSEVIESYFLGHLNHSIIDHLIDHHIENSAGLPRSLLNSPITTHEQAIRIGSKIGDSSVKYKHASIKGSDIKSEDDLTHSSAGYILHNARDPGAIKKALKFYDKNPPEVQIKAASGMIETAVDDADIRHALFHHPAIHKKAIEYGRTEPALKIRLKSLSDPNISDDVKLENAKSIMSESPDAYKFAAVHATKNTPIGEMVQNGFNRYIKQTRERFAS